MFRNINLKSVIKIMGIALACIAALIITRIIITGSQPAKVEAGEAVETVLEGNQVDIPEIDQDHCEAYSIEINDGKPFFTADEIAEAVKREYFIDLSDCDPLKRAQVATMCAAEEYIRTEERDSDLSSFEPTGWHRNSIYERSHLLMWKLSGPDDFRNLITGTEYFNQVEMLGWEEQVTGYLWKNPDKHVLYRVTPYFVGEELIARGVLMEALSLEDNGGLSFCEFVYNAQPGSEIDYETGAYHMYESWQTALE